MIMTQTAPLHCFHRLQAYLGTELDSAVASHPSGFSLLSVLAQGSLFLPMVLMKPGLDNVAENYSFSFNPFGSFHFRPLILAKQVDFGWNLH